MAKKKKRPYSYEFKAQGEPKRYLLSGIPPTLWRKFQARCRREHVAMRQVLLGFVEEWTNRPEEPVEPLRPDPQRGQYADNR